jgi:hypothetical protein
MEARMRALEEEVLRLKKTVTWQRFEMERIRRATGVSEPQSREERMGGTKSAPLASNGASTVTRKPVRAHTKEAAPAAAPANGEQQK